MKGASQAGNEIKKQKRREANCLILDANSKDHVLSELVNQNDYDESPMYDYFLWEYFDQLDRIRKIEALHIKIVYCIKLLNDVRFRTWPRK